MASTRSPSSQNMKDLFAREEILPKTLKQKAKKVVYLSCASDDEDDHNPPSNLTAVSEKTPSPELCPLPFA